ncbi:GTP-binding domain [Bacillus phage G]|uniref:Gp66 n=1 Tax=Bacillus phage G TaxID=2884420 RepID=G3MBD6_9CAUD|nr:GTP-binding domain [Bacillus phage G]AEO93337.1 gp66 [Bacillus phage G]
MVSISFTGHRPDKIGNYGENEEEFQLVYNWLDQTIEKMIQRFDYVRFISGGAQGVDLWAAEIILEKKKLHTNKNIKLTMAIPYKGFGERWPDEVKQQFYKLVSLADETIYVHKGSFDAVGNYILQVRNEWMVNHSDLIIAVWDGSNGGTRNCFKYAESRKKRILRFNPFKKEVVKYN